jgi:small-conductance mechanosensitive channel
MELETVMTHPVSMGIVWILGGIICAVIAIIITNILENFASRRNLAIIEVILAGLRIPIAGAFLLVGVYVGCIWLGVEQKWVYNVLKSLLVAVSAYGIVSISTAMIRKWGIFLVRKTKTRADDNFLPLFQGFFKLGILMIAFGLILNSWGVHITALIAGLGIAGLAVGLALQGTMANILGGMALILDDTYNVGDTIHLDTGETGEIIHIGLRSTKMINDDLQQMVIPNSTLANAKIVNYALPDPHLRIVVDVGVAYGSDVNKVRKVLLGSIKGIDGVVDEPKPLVHFKDMGESSINFQLKFFIDDYRTRHALRSEALQRVYENLQLAGVEIPYPTRTVYVKK